MKIEYTHLECFKDDFIPCYEIPTEGELVTCPDCGEILDHLDYYTNGNESGSYNPGWEETHQAEDTDFGGDTYYNCPECSCDIDSWEDCYELTELDKKVLMARFNARNEGTWNIENFSKKRKHKTIYVETPTEESTVTKKGTITNKIIIRTCKKCTRIIPVLMRIKDKNFCPNCMKEYHEEEDN